MAVRVLNYCGADFFQVNQDRSVEKISKTIYGKNKQILWDRFNIRFDDSMVLDRFIQVLKDNKVKNEFIVKYKNRPGVLATNQIVHITFNCGVSRYDTIDGKRKRIGKRIYNVAKVREILYRDGFDIDGVHYVRWMRSSSNARVGNCYFIAEKWLNAMNKFSDFNIDLSKEQTLAAVEAYRSLVMSNQIGKVHIEPKNILLIEDRTSTFTDTVMLTTSIDGKLVTEPKEVEVENKIFDGQSLMDKSMFPEEYQDKGMLLLRHKAFKSCCFNTNIQQWFKDNGITDISQLNGKHTADATLEDIKLITTKSSIKYAKFGSKDNWFEEWCALIVQHKTNAEFGIVKYEKPTKYYDGKYVRTHYQLLNTLDVDAEDLRELIQPTIKQMQSMIDDPAVVYDYCKDNMTEGANTNTEFVFNMLSANWEFSLTDIYQRKVAAIINNIKDELKIGRVLVPGNYSTLLSCPIEMLKEAIGRFDGTSNIGVGNIVSTAFEPKELLACRSPHICAGNIYIPTNVRNDLVEKYVNLTDNIVVINTINENLMMRLSGADFDSDTILIVDEPILIKAAKKDYGKFLVPTTDIEPKKHDQAYTPENLAELDYKTSKNLIGQIVNQSQKLNSTLWEMYRLGEDVDDIYRDICTLSILSGIEIDKAKKDFTGMVNSGAELDQIRQKRENKYPVFFRVLDRKKHTSRSNYKQFDTTLDRLYGEVSKLRISFKTQGIPINMIFNKDIHPRGTVNTKLLDKFDNLCRIRQSRVIQIQSDNSFDKSDKIAKLAEVRQEFYDDIEQELPKLKFINIPTIREIFKRYGFKEKHLCRIEEENKVKKERYIADFELEALIKVGATHLPELIQKRVA